MRERFEYVKLSEMRTANSNSRQQPPASVSPAEEMGIGPKKTALILFTVVGCIAILFPKIFYPMMVGPTQKGNRDPIDLWKQERPPFKDRVYPSMHERGQAIQHSVPILERPGVPGGLPPIGGARTIERRPGAPMVPGQPGPNMRAAAFQAQQTKTQSSTSILMPIYTIGIVAFFVFTIVKLVMKKTNKKEKTPREVTPDLVFEERVFRPTQASAEPKDKKLVLTAIQGIIDATTEQLNDIEKVCAEKNTEHPDGSDAKEKVDTKSDETVFEELMKAEDEEVVEEKTKPLLTEHDLQIEKRLELLKEALHVKAVENDENSDLKSIFLDGELPHDPSILVSATETEAKTERISKYTDIDTEIADDEAVVLSGKMTISFLSLPSHQEQCDKENQDTNNKDASTKA